MKSFLTLFTAEGLTALEGIECVPVGPTATEEPFTSVTGPVVEEFGNPRPAAPVLHDVMTSNWRDRMNHCQSDFNRIYRKCAKECASECLFPFTADI